LQLCESAGASVEDGLLKIIVLESEGLWAAALRRKLAIAAPTVRETRSVAECDAELTAAPASFVIAELTARYADRLMEQVDRWRVHRSLASLALVADRRFTAWRELALEAGAALIVFSPRKIADLVAAIQRHAARRPQPPGNTADRIWAELPLGNERT
jgi:hypothetical protein